MRPALATKQTIDIILFIICFNRSITSAKACRAVIIVFFKIGDIVPLCVDLTKFFYVNRIVQN